MSFFVELIARVADYRELADLRAQQEMAIWAKWMFWATVGSLVLSSFAFAALLVSLRQTRRSIEIAQHLGEAQTRAYIVIVSARAHLEKANFSNHDLDMMRFEITAKVGGNTPARDVVVNFGVKALFRNAREDHSYSSPGEFLGGQLPGNEFPVVSLAYHVDVDHFDEILMADAAFEVTGKVSYRVFGGDGRKQTQFSYTFGKSNMIGSDFDGVEIDLLPEPILDQNAAT